MSWSCTRSSCECWSCLHRSVPVSVPVGYTMRDIRYKWNEGPNSVGVSNEVSLPQFKVLGHRQRAMEISLTTGITPIVSTLKHLHVKHLLSKIWPSRCQHRQSGMPGSLLGVTLSKTCKISIFQSCVSVWQASQGN